MTSSPEEPLQVRNSANNAHQTCYWADYSKPRPHAVTCSCGWMFTAMNSSDALLASDNHKAESRV